MRLRLRAEFRFDRPSRRDLIVFGGYCLASGLYVAIGITYVDFLLSFWVGAAYLLLVAWLVPTAVRRLL